MYQNGFSKKAKRGGFQGDVAVVRVDRLPDEAVKAKSNIVALGESTGHHHILDERVEVYTVANDIYFVVAPDMDEVELRHQEHGALLFDEGVFKVIHQVEYDGEEERQVRD